MKPKDFELLPAAVKEWVNTGYWEALMEPLGMHMQEHLYKVKCGNVESLPLNRIDSTYLESKLARQSGPKATMEKIK